MAKQDTEICPQCSSSVKSSISRLIRDSCGHNKCRLCLMKEEGGCIACKLKVSEGHESPEINNDDSYFEEHETNLDMSTIITTISESENKSITMKTESSEKPVNVSDKVVHLGRATKKGNLKIGNHLTIVPGTPLKYHCTICNKLCASKMTIRYHNYCASPTKPFTCEICNKGFITKTHFEYHCRVHTGVLPYVCATCGKGFKQQGKLNRHSRIHSGERPFVCQECGKTFASIESLKNHQRGHSEKPYSCSVCPKTFKDYSNFKKHVYSHKGEKTFMCDECGKTFAFKRSLMAHIFIHTRERNYICDKCNRKFAMKRDLKRHEIVHFDVRPHSCTLCKIGFRRKDNLERHMKNTHPETRTVTIGPAKQRLGTEKYKLPIKNNKQSDMEVGDKIGDTGNSIDVDSIPPSQTINPEILHSVPILFKKKAMFQSQNGDVPLESKSQSSEKSPNPILMKNNSSCDSNPCLQESFQVEQGNENITCASSDSNTTGSQTIYPPKKNIEYYRAVPVINRSNNSTIIYNESLNTKENNQEILRKGERTNCVPTITRASEYVSGSVITRNHQSTTIIEKPTTSHENIERLVKLSCIRELRSEQPSLRRLLHDVKCCDDEILNLTHDENVNKSSLLHQNLRSINESKTDTSNCGETEFSSPMCPDTYVSDPSAGHDNSDYNPNTDPCYANVYHNRKMDSDLFTDVQFRLNSNPPFYCHLTSSPYMDYQNGNGTDVTHNFSKVPSNEVLARYSEGSKMSLNTNYVSYNKRLEESDERLKLSCADNPENVSCVQSIEQPVIVGGKKTTNNVICSNFSS